MRVGQVRGAAVNFSKNLPFFLLCAIQFWNVSYISGKKGSFMYKIEFYVPESHLEAVKRAMFGAGAGKIGNYDSCCWQIKEKEVARIFS